MRKRTKSKISEEKRYFKYKYVLSREDISNIDEDSLKDYWEVIRKFSENMNGKSYEDLQGIMDVLYLLSIETGILDKNVNFLNNNIFNNLRSYLQTEYCNNPKVKKHGDKLLLKAKDIEQQFFFPTEEGERPRSELLCNIMFLANTMAHLVEENHLGYLFTREIDEKKVKNTFMRIKDFCMKELIKCRKKGEIILIEKVKEIYSDSDVYYIAIPGYLEPFGVHSNSVKAKNQQFDELDFHNYKLSNMDNLHTVFPLKVSSEKEKIIRQYIDPNRTQPKELKGIRDRLLWYINTQDRFEEIRKGKMKQAPKTVEVKEEKDTKDVKTDKAEVKFKEATTSPTELNEDIPKKRTRNKRPEKAEMFKEINKDFLEKLNEQLGGIIGPAMMDKFLNRASYSFEALINGKLKSIATPFFENKNLDESQMNNELLKIFIYIRMFAKISVINNSRVDDENSIEAVRNAFINYEDAFDFMQKNKDRNLSYDDMQNGIMEYLANRGEREEENEAVDSEPEEESEVEEREYDNGKIEKKEKVFKELKGVTESIVGEQEIKSLSEDSIEVLKERKKEIKQLIKQNEDQINEAILSGESQETILEHVKELRELINEQKVLRKEIKRKIKQFKLQKKRAKNNIKESQEKRGEAIDRL